MRRVVPLVLVPWVASLCVGCGGGQGTGGIDAGSGLDGSVTLPDTGTPLPPGDPGPSDVAFAIVANEDVRAISPYVYGHNASAWEGRGAHVRLGRSGGNRMTAYNWENNASNAGSDWYHQNDAFLGGGDVPGEVVRAGVEDAFDHGAAMLVTVPLIGHVAADKNGGGDVNATPNYLTTRFRESVARKGSAFSLTPNTNDAFVYQDEFVNFLETTFPEARQGGPRTLFYSMDNEPDLWSHTHARIHPAALRYDELIDLNIAYADAVKDVAPSARVFGFVSYGWTGFINLQDAPDAAGRDFIDTYLDAMQDAEAEHGRRLIDVLDLHFYPEAQGDGQRIITDTSTPGLVEARIQAPRSLWDSGYVETSWITEWSTLGPIRLIPRMREKIAAHYPGTELAFTEYNYGGGPHISGAIAQADVLGIYGREGVFAACLWPMSENEAFIWAAFDAFVNYDGAGGDFGDVSIRANTSDLAMATVYASVDAANPSRLVIVAINKTNSAQTAGITIAHGTSFGHAEAYVITAAASAPVRGADVPITETNAFGYEMPAMSVTTLVLVAE